jgi:hypothetical protein
VRIRRKPALDATGASHDQPKLARGLITASKTAFGAVTDGAWSGVNHGGVVADGPVEQMGGKPTGAGGNTGIRNGWCLLPETQALLAEIARRSQRGLGEFAEAGCLT